MAVAITPRASRHHAKTASPTASPALMMARSESEKRSRGAGTAFIIAFSAVGKRKVWVTRWRSITSNASSGAKRRCSATISRPK